MASAVGETAVGEETLALQRMELSDDSDDDFKYDGVSDDDDLLASDSEEEDGADGDLGLTLAALTKKRDEAAVLEAAAAPDTRPVTDVRPTVLDDFLRNYLIRLGLTRTLDTFNTEW